MAHEYEDRHRGTATVVVEVGGLHWGSEKNVMESVLGRRPGVVAVEANPVAQTATVTYDPARTGVVDLRDWLRDCGYHCEGQSVPAHICDPLMEPPPPEPAAHDDADAHPRTPGQAPHSRDAGHEDHTGDGESPRSRTRPWATAAVMPACRWRRWSPACVGDSCSRRCSPCRSCCGRGSVGTSSASTWPLLSVCATTPSSYFCPFP